MNVLDFLSRRQARQRDEHVTAWQRYRRLLQSFVDGVEIDVHEADEIIAGANKSEAELQRDVELLARRHEWRGQIDAAAAAAEEQKQAEAEIAEVNRKIREYSDKLQPKADAARERLRAAEARRGAEHIARQGLRRSVMDPDVRDRMTVLQADRQELAETLKNAKEQAKQNNVGYWQGRLASAQRRIAKTNRDDRNSCQALEQEITLCRTELSDAEQGVGPWQREAAAAERRLAEIEIELEQLHERSLEP